MAYDSVRKRGTHANYYPQDSRHSVQRNRRWDWIALYVSRALGFIVPKRHSIRRINRLEVSCRSPAS